MEPSTEPLFSRYMKSLVYSMARFFPVRPGNCAEATVICLALRAHGLPSTLGKLSKAGDDAAEIVAEYLTASDQLRTATPSDDFYLSVKPPALDFSARHVARIVEKAIENGQGVHFDAHGFAFAEATFRLLDEAIGNTGAAPGRDWTFGVTLPSRWKRSILDAQWVAKNGVRPRLVKGDFPGSAADEMDPVKGYLELVDLLAGEVPELAVATHDAVLAREVVARCRRKGAAVEFELFFGMPSSSMMSLARELQVPVRFYVPYGDTLIVYMVRDLLANPHKVLRPNALELLATQETKLARITALPSTRV
jgi:proline dehydrogenase